MLWWVALGSNPAQDLRLFCVEFASSPHVCMGSLLFLPPPRKCNDPTPPWGLFSLVKTVTAEDKAIDHRPLKHACSLKRHLLISLLYATASASRTIGYPGCDACRLGFARVTVEPVRQNHSSLRAGRSFKGQTSRPLLPPVPSLPPESHK